MEEDEKPGNGIEAKDEKDKSAKTYWHTAFRAAMRIELEDYKDYLEFTDEYQLTQDALRIDLLIVKKLSGIDINNDVGRIFKGHNLIILKTR